MNIEGTPPQLPLVILLLNYFPLLFLAALAGAIYYFVDSAGEAILLTLFWIYLLPPLACRFVLAFCGEPDNHATIGSSSFRSWWFLTQLQAPFNRFTALEELLRLIPSAYSIWLCLWGSRVSPFVLWSPGVRITDRYLLQVDPRAVVGWGAQLSPHLVAHNDQGESELIVGRIMIGEGAIIGGHAILGPGSRVHSGESFPATRVLGPFHSYSNGRRGARSNDQADPKHTSDQNHDPTNTNS